MEGGCDGETRALPSSSTNNRDEPGRLGTPLGIFDTVCFPSGKKMSNRLVKAAMYEHLAPMFGGPPNANHLSLYSRWAKGSWGMIITGNVQVCKDHLSLGRDMVAPERLKPDTIKPFAELAAVIHGDVDRGSHEMKNEKHRTLAIMQLSHSGRQAANFIGGRWPFVRPLAPSAIPIGTQSKRVSPEGHHSPFSLSSLINTVMFQTPREMSLKDIDDVVGAFVRGARLAVRSGFDGVELHAGHGYLLAQFISPKTNTRTDEYSGTEFPLQFMHRIVNAIRDAVPSDFVLGIKLNAADYVPQPHGSGQADTTGEERALEHVQEIASWCAVDFIEVTGGNYENPEFMTTSSQSLRQALFAHFSQRALKQLLEKDTPRRPLIMVTGGLSTPELFSSALAQRHAEMLGAGRLSVLSPELPKILEHDPDNLQTLGASTSKLMNESLEGSNLSSLEHIELATSGLLYWLWANIPLAIRPVFPPLIGAGAEMASYVVLIRGLASGSTPPFFIGDSVGAIVRMWLYIAPGYSSYWIMLPGLMLAMATLLVRVSVTG